MKTIGAAFAVIIGIALLFVAAFGMEMGALKWAGFFRPKWQDVERQTFERTQSYTHGKIQDLAKYYEEFTESEDSEERSAIKSLVRMNFAEFDESTVRNDKLRTWLIEQRGF